MMWRMLCWAKQCAADIRGMLPVAPWPLATCMDSKDKAGGSELMARISILHLRGGTVGLSSSCATHAEVPTRKMVAVPC